MPSLKVKLFNALESFLRVPPLLIVDEIFRISFGIGNNANKYYHSGGILSPFQQQQPQQKTTYIPDRGSLDDLSKSDRLDNTDNDYINETVSSNILSGAAPSGVANQPTTPNPAFGLLFNVPLVNELWKTFTDGFLEVFNASSQQQAAGVGGGIGGSVGTPPPTTSTIIQDAASDVTGNPAVASAATSAATATAYQQDYFEFSTAQAAADLIKLAEVIMCIVVFLVAIITFMLATENLIKLYSHLFSFFALYLSFIFTPFPTAIAVSSIFPLLYNFTCRSFIAAMYYACRSWPGGGNTIGGVGVNGSGFNLSGNGVAGGAGVVSGRGGGGENNAGGGGVGGGGVVDGGIVTTGEPNNNNCNNSVLSSATEGILLGMFFITGAVTISPLTYVILMIGLHHPLLRCLPEVYAFLKSSWNETKRVQNEYGLSHLIQVESGRLRVNTVFRLFWITRALYDAASNCYNGQENSVLRYVMTHGTETFTGVVGLTVTVSAICHHIGECLLFVLYNGANTEADANRFGSISTVLFFILSLQTGLTSLDPEKRLDRLAKNIVLLGTALFHALHQMISPVLTAFRAFQTLQIRAAALSCSSFLISLLLTCYLLRYSTISTWSLAVLALAIEFKIKIFISLLISFVVYLSQLVQYPEPVEKFVNTCRRVLPTSVVRFFDHLHDELSHEDVVFYLRSIANVGEFLTGIFLFANAVWIFFFESASAIRAIGMSVHAYFNIWCEAQKGWRVYCQRKTASQKIMSLADATDEQLRSRQDDVCAVCYEEMESAKVTNCNHLFHAVCLRKWLYVQNTCPLCHEVLYREDALDSSAENEGGDATPPPPQPQAEAPAAAAGGGRPVPPPQQQRQTESNQNSLSAGNTAMNDVNSSSSIHRTNRFLNVPGSRRGSRQISYERNGNPSSDENDTEPETSTARTSINGNHIRANSGTMVGGGSGQRVEAVRYSVFSSSGSADSSSSAGSSSGGGTGVRSRFFDMNSTSDSENGGSSGSEYTVDDGSDADDLWANDYSSSDEDENQPGGGPSGGVGGAGGTGGGGGGGGGGQRRNRGAVIGVPLLL